MTSLRRNDLVYANSQPLQITMLLQKPLVYKALQRLIYPNKLSGLLRPCTPKTTTTAGPAIHHPATGYSRQMATKSKSGIPHQARTAAEPRQNRLYPVRLSHIDQVNPAVRLLQLTIPPHVQNPESDGLEEEEVLHTHRKREIYI